MKFEGFLKILISTFLRVWEREGCGGDGAMDLWGKEAPALT